MKSNILVIIFLASVIFTNCNPARKAASVPATSQPAMAAVYYAPEVKTLIETKCTPCHIPANGGRKEPLNTYASAKEHIADIIRRIELKPEEKGFMPFKHPKLSEAEINVFKNWQATGLQDTK